MPTWITLPRSAGETSRQAHTDLPSGSFERELGKEGFAGPATQMYHRHPPTGWIEFEGTLKPRAFDTTKLIATSTTPWDAAQLLGNDHTRIRFWRTEQNMDHLVRNADGDELLFIHQGEAELFCDYGHLSIREGDYVMLPRGTMWRIETAAPLSMLLIEATSDSFTLPDKGILGHHAIFDPAILDTPQINDPFRAQQSSNTHWRVVVKRCHQFSSITYPFNPLDAIGWHGTLMPLRINWRDIRPLMSHRYHLPPSAHATFVSRRFLVCTFCPRPMESDPGALKVPFFHSNDDYDEVLFYHMGDFFSRDNIHPGMMSFHPSGFPHGPHPKALAAGVKTERKATNEVAVMIDTRDALMVAPQAEEIEWTAYVDSWKG